MKKLCFAIILFSTAAFAKFEAPHIPVENHRLCVDKVCSILKSYQCNDRDEILRISDACTRQIDLNCIDLSTSKLSSWEYNDPDELLKLVKSCHYVNSRSVRRMTSELAGYEMDDLNEVIRINDGAYLVDPRCYVSATKNLRSFHVDDVNEVRDISLMCQGTFKKRCFQKQCDSSWKCDDVSEVKDALRKCVDGPSPQDRRRL